MRGWIGRDGTVAPMIRAATTDDAARMAEIYRPFVEGDSTSFETTPPDAAEMAHRLERTTATHPWIVLVDDDTGAVVAYAYAIPFRTRAAYRWCVETSVYVDREHARRGHGRRLMTVLLELLDELGYHEAVAGVTLPNPPSVSLHEALGFVEVGSFPRSGWKLGRWHDVGFWSRSIRHGDPDDEPVAWPSHAASGGDPIDAD